MFVRVAEDGAYAIGPGRSPSRRKPVGRRAACRTQEIGATAARSRRGSVRIFSRPACRKNSFSRGVRMRA